MVKNLKFLREKHGLSQQRLATEIGVSQQSINKYENHNVEPDIDTLITMANRFETSVDYLIGRSTVDHILEEVFPSDLNSEELAVIQAYRTLLPKEKESIHLILENYNINRTNSKTGLK